MFFIAGKWHDSSRRLPVVSPVNGAELGSVAVSSPEDVETAAAAARLALQTPLSSYRRSQLLHSVAEQLAKDRSALGELIAWETGKILPECLQEIDRAITTVTWSAEEALRLEGTVLPCDVTDQENHQQAFVMRVPIGVVAAITPFNFPINIPVHKMAPGLAAGNSVILKPSPRTPLSANRLITYFERAGWPPGWVGLVHGEAAVTCQLAASDIAAVSFTGGPAAGMEIARRAAAKRVLLELGGNDPIILEPDADLNLAGPIILQHRFGSSGQRCTSCKRLFVHQSRYQEILGYLERALQDLVVGDPFDPRTRIGPLICEEAARLVERQVEALVRAGGKVLIGGRRDRNYYWPTLVVDADPSSTAAQEEVFGPVLPVYKYADISQVYSWVNSSPHGLQAGLFSNNLRTIKEAFSRLQVGALLVNQGPNYRLETLPFGSMKAGGLGREGIKYFMQEVTTLKSLIM